MFRMVPSRVALVLWALPLAVLPGCNGDNGSSKPGSTDVSPRRSTDAEASPPVDAHTPSPTRGDVTLERDQREFLWDCEHRGLVLARRGFPQSAKALAAANDAALLERLADDFHAEIFQEPKEVKAINESVQAI